MQLSNSDWIAIASLVVALIALSIAFLALRETRRTNRIALLQHHSSIYDAFSELAIAALCEGHKITENSVSKFSSHALDAQKYLPERLRDDVSQFYDDCQCLLFMQSLQHEPDPPLQSRADSAHW